MPPKSDEQKTTAKIALAAKKKGPSAVSKLKDPAKSMAKMTIAQLEKFAKGKIKKESKSLKENQEMGEPNPDAARLIQNLEFWVVEKAPEVGGEPGDIVFKSNPIHFADQMKNGLDPDNILGFYLDETEAMDAAHDEVSSVWEAAKSLEEKKSHVISEIDKHIARLQKEINRHMKEAGEMPEEGDKHYSMAEKKMGMIKALRERHKMVSETKKELKPREEE